VQPRIYAETEALVRMLGDPLVRRLADQIARREDGGIDLFGQLRHIASIDEDDRLCRGDQRLASRSGETSEPGQPLGGCRHIFPLIFIGARHKETVDTKLVKSPPERLDPLAAELRGRGDIE